MKKTISLVRAAALAALAFGLSFFDKGLDGIISQFTKLDAKLDREIAKLAHVRVDEAARRVASFERETAVHRKEYALRSNSFSRAEAARRAADRASRIKERIANLTA